MNVLEILTCAISMQLATILKGVTPALATVDMQAMGYFAQVSASIFQSEHAHVTILVTMYYLQLYYFVAELGALCLLFINIISFSFCLPTFNSILY